MIILNDKQIKQKLRRLAFEIIEQNSSESEIILAGVNNNGYACAKLLKRELNKAKVTDIKFTLAQINLNPCLLYTSPSPRDRARSRMPSSA